jgi:hypothetical protein
VTEAGFVKWLAQNVVEKGFSGATYALVKDARHLFGNPKAARKTAWEDDGHRERDEL